MSICVEHEPRRMAWILIPLLLLSLCHKAFYKVTLLKITPVNILVHLLVRNSVGWAFCNQLANGTKSIMEQEWEIKINATFIHSSIYPFSDWMIVSWFRINQAPTRGFEKDVGYRTTHHVMYPESAIDLSNDSTSLLLVPFKTLDLQWIISALSTGQIT